MQLFLHLSISPLPPRPAAPLPPTEFLKKSLKHSHRCFHHSWYVSSKLASPIMFCFRDIYQIKITSHISKNKTLANISDDHYICYCGQESLRRNGLAIIVNKRVWNAVLGCNLKNDRMISVRFNITVIQVYALTSNAEEAEVEQFYEDLQDLPELTVTNTNKKMSFSLQGTRLQK